MTRWRRPGLLGLLVLLAGCGAPRPTTPPPPPKKEVAPLPPNEGATPRAAIDAGAASSSPLRCGEGMVRDPRGGSHETQILVAASPAGASSARTPPKELQVSRDGATLLAVREDGAAFVWDVRDSRLRARLARTPLPVRRPRSAWEEEEQSNESFTLAGDGARVVGLSSSPGEHGWEIRLTERVWDSASGKVVSSRSRLASAYVLIATQDLTRRAIWANGYFADAGGDLLIAGIPPSTPKAIGARKGLAMHAAWSEDGTRFAVTRADPSEDLSNKRSAELWSTLEVWDVTAEGARAPLRFEHPLDHDEIEGFTGGGALLVTRGDTRTVVLDAATGTERATLDAVGEMLPSARRDVVVLRARPAPAKGAPARERPLDVIVFDAASGARRRVFAFPDQKAPSGEGSAALRPDGLRLATSDGTRACVVSLDDGAVVTDIAWNAEIRWSADGAALQGIVESAADVRVRTLRLEGETVEERVVWFGSR